MVFISWRLPDDPGGITCMSCISIIVKEKCTDSHEIQHDYASYVDDHSVSFFYGLYDF